MRSIISICFSRITRPWPARIALCIGLYSSAWAQAPASAIAVGSPLAVTAAYANGQRFNPSTLEGTVTIAFFWNSDCSVCRDSLPELRANLAGWKAKPFSLLLVNLDRKTDDWQAYEKLVDQTQINTKGLLSVRMDGELPAGVRLPLTLLIDRKGKVLKRFEGRLAPEVWDGVADLLP